MKKGHLQESRIRAILGNDDEDVSEGTVKSFCDYLRKDLQFSLEVTGIEGSDWEESSAVGPGEKKKHQQLNRTDSQQP